MRERAPRSGMASPSPLDGYKAPYPPPPIISRPLPLLYRSLTNSPLLPALLAGPGFGCPHSPAAVPPPCPFNHFCLPLWPDPHTCPQFSCSRPPLNVSLCPYPQRL